LSELWLGYAGSGSPYTVREGGQGSARPRAPLGQKVFPVVRDTSMWWWLRRGLWGPVESLDAYSRPYRDCECLLSPNVLSKSCGEDDPIFGQSVTRTSTESHAPKGWIDR